MRRRPRAEGLLLALALALALSLAGCSSAAPHGAATVSPVPAGPRSPTPLLDGDWPTYHRDALRTGLAPGVPTVTALRQAWKAGLDGAVYGQPLVVGGRVLAATENNTVYALDAAGGSVLWSRHLGTPARGAELPCGNIDPLGITGTPVYDPSSGLVFVVAELSGGVHELVGLDAASGDQVVRRELEPPKGDRIAHQQRAALALWDGRVVVAFGGLFGDCGSYVGSVLSVPVSGAGDVRSYAVPTAREGGIWAPAGPVVDDGRLLVAVGNGAATGGSYDGSDSVLSLSPELQRTDFFAPSVWAMDNAGDADLGSMSPVRVGRFVLTAGKGGVAYLLDAARLGGIGGQLAQTPVCPVYGGAAVAGSTVYLPCQDGIQELTVGPEGSLTSGWKLPLAAAGSPVVGGNAVWAADTGEGQLYAVDRISGRVLAQTATGRLPHFASPVLVGSRVLLGTLSGVTAFDGS